MPLRGAAAGMWRAAAAGAPARSAQHPRLAQQAPAAALLQLLRPRQQVQLLRRCWLCACRAKLLVVPRLQQQAEAAAWPPLPCCSCGLAWPLVLLLHPLQQPAVLLVRAAPCCACACVCCQLQVLLMLLPQQLLRALLLAPAVEPEMLWAACCAAGLLAGTRRPAAPLLKGAAQRLCLVLLALPRLLARWWWWLQPPGAAPRKAAAGPSRRLRCRWRRPAGCCWRRLLQVVLRLPRCWCRCWLAQIRCCCSWWRCRWHCSGSRAAGRCCRRPHAPRRRPAAPGLRSGSGVAGTCQ